MPHNLHNLTPSTRVRTPKTVSGFRRGTFTGTLPPDCHLLVRWDDEPGHQYHLGPWEELELLQPEDDNELAATTIYGEPEPQND